MGGEIYNRLIMWITDPKSKEKSVTLTAFVVGFAAASGKLLISGITIGGLVMSPFTGVDFAAAVGALGAIYVMRRHNSQKDK